MKITKEQEKFITELTQKMEKQNNRSTQYPLFYIYEKKEVACARGEDPDITVFIDDDGEKVFEYVDEEGKLWLVTDDGSWTCTEKDQTLDAWEFEDQVTSEFTKQEYKEIDSPVVNVGPFFTEKAAQEHIESNNYHYNRPFIYVNSAWRNYEMQDILKLIFIIAGKEIPSQYK